MAFKVGESVGHYQIVEELGAGGNGRVLKVEHLITRRGEAMKILSRGRPASPEFGARLLREIRLQASLDHPNIAAVLNAFWLEDDLIMVMELIEGESLQSLLARRRPTLEQSLAIIRQVMLALGHAHMSGVVHRDVSTANIVVTSDGVVKLTDFGLAKGQADLHITESGSMVGSPYYISPEQVRGATGSDYRSDIYSTGIVLYEMLTGSRPYEAESTFLLMQAHVQQHPVAPIERNPAIPRFISDAILKAIEKHPENRFQSAADFLAALEGPVETLPLPLAEPAVSPTPAPPPEAPPSHSYAAPIPAEPTPAKRKKRKLSPVMAACLGVAVVLAAFIPMAFRGSNVEQPKYNPQSVPAATLPALPAPAGDESPAPSTPLQAGPKDVPTLQPQPVRSGAARMSQPVQSKAPPKVVVWGEAKPTAIAQGSSDDHESAPPPPSAPPARKIEEPPVLAPQASKPTVEPSLPQTGTTVQKRGIFRRLANGVKALNPIRRENNNTNPNPSPDNN